MKVKKITDESAKVSWGDATGATSYKVQRRALGTNSWKSKTTSETKLKLNNLSPNTSYEWRVTTFCTGLPDDKSSYSMLDTFTTLPFKISLEEPPIVEVLNVYPVPAADQVTIQTSGEGNSSVIVRNMIGTIMYRNDAFGLEGGSLQISVKQWPAGVYLVELNDGLHATVRKIIRE